MRAIPIVLDSIPFHIDDQETANLLGPAADDGAMEGELGALINQAREISRPKAVYRPCYVEDRDGDRTTIEGVAFESRVLAVNLKDAHRVFPYVATCGGELALWAASVTDPLARFWADGICELAVRAAGRHLIEHLRSGYGLAKAASMNPGSLQDWPLTQQTPLFRLIGDVERLVGVTLTESYLMLPTKSVSGIRFPLETSFESCMLCPRDSCPGRRAPFDPALYARRYGKGAPDA